MEHCLEFMAIQQMSLSGQAVVLGIASLLIFSETSSFYGLVISGISYFVPLLGVLAGAGILDVSISLIFICCFMASFIGDLVAYKRGFNLQQEAFPKEESYYYKKHYIHRIRQLLDRYGKKVAIFLTKFLPFIKTVFPVYAGREQMDFLKYFLMNLFTCAFMYAVLLFPFYYTGKGIAAAWPMLVTAFVVMLVMGLIFLTYRFYLRLRLKNKGK
ncbi:VTT domain-containing protein [Cytophagaceae bacterium ABcell3]|nr:VTT domain-containing protein [Cytophagaceae bacterium ABcell3]